MFARRSAALALLLLAGPAAGQVTWRAVDGDTLAIGGQRYRLFAADTPELRQDCYIGADRAGVVARDYLAGLIAGQAVVCREVDRDRYRRIVAVCGAGGVDLSAAMIAAGLAWVDERYARGAYAAEAAAAEAAGRGLWAGGQCMTAREWRAR